MGPGARSPSSPVAGDRAGDSSRHGDLAAGEREPARERLGFQRLDSSPWKELSEALSRKPSRDTVPRNGARGGGSMTKNKVRAQLQKQAPERRGTSREEVVYL